MLLNALLMWLSAYGASGAWDAARPAPFDAVGGPSLPRHAFQLGLREDVAWLRSEYPAVCPDVNPSFCEKQPLPVHVREEEVLVSRSSLSLRWGVTDQVQLALVMPVELRSGSVDVQLVDGTPYTPPYLELHTVDERLVGLADGRFYLSMVGPPTRGWDLAFALGSTLPWAKSQPDPYRAGAAGRAHTHLTWGEGVPIPLAYTSVAWRTARWGLGGSLAGRLPLWTNAEGLRASRTLGLLVEPMVWPAPRIGIGAGVGLELRGPEVWSGLEHGGQMSVFVGPQAEAQVVPRLALSLAARVQVMEQLWDRQDEPSFVMPFQLRLALDWRPKARPGP